MVRMSLLLLILISVIGCNGVADLSTVPPPEAQTAPTPQPPKVFFAPTGFVNDAAKVLDPAVAKQLERELRKFRDEQKVDFAIVTVSTTGPESIDDYSLAMSREWKLGSDNGGLLLMVAIDDRKWRIQMDRKLERILSKDEVLEIGELMISDLNSKRYSAGITKSVDAMIVTLAKKFDQRK